MNIDNFKLILKVIFGVFLVAGFASLSIYGLLQRDNQNVEGNVPNLVVWGTIDNAEVSDIFKDIASKNYEYGSVTYVEKRRDSFEEEYINAIALNVGPDLVLIDDELINSLYKTFLTIPFASLPRAIYQQSFIAGADYFDVQEGYIAVPFLADSMVLFYNENLRLQSGIRSIPRYWSQFSTQEYFDLVGRYKRQGFNLIPLGAYSNYNSALDLFLTILNQSKGSDNETSKRERSDVLTFYSSFANPRSPLYSWNVSLPNARDVFIAGKLLYYPGYASEYDSLRRSNPNLPIKVAPLPQTKIEIPSQDGTGNIEIKNPIITPLKLYGFAIPERTPYRESSLNFVFDMIGIFSDQNNINTFSPLQPATTRYVLPNTANSEEQIFNSSIYSGRILEKGEGVLELISNLIIGTVEIDSIINNNTIRKL